MNITPAEYVIQLMGGVRPAARKLKYSPSAVSRWRTMGGEIPTKARKRILKYAEKHGLAISPIELEYGKTVTL